MKILHIRALAIPDVKVVRFARFRDSRGYFTESFRHSDFQTHPDAGCFQGVQFVQINESYSRPGTLRGLHFQWNPQMGKLVRTVAGRMVDFALDIRKGSPFFGHVIAYDMPSTAEQSYGEWIWVPPGFAHGNFFPQRTRIEYLCSGQWSPGCEAGISPLAADLDWSLCDGKCKALLDAAAAGKLLISDKDRAGLTLAQWRDDPRAENFLYGQV
ncbi:MAG: dTDP-4-dehydrorhamnose 3,5-epimerase family protein [Thermoguttaceae bacterium]